jgi:DNA-binding response OmpR family regulator
MATKLLSGLDALIIEDEPLLRKQLAAYLVSLGAEAIGVATLQAARQSLAESRYDHHPG